jgi:hypothetical protein
VTGRIGTLVAVRTKVWVLAVCGVLFLAAACSSGGGATPLRFVEKSTAIAEADAICKQGDAEVKQLTADFNAAHAAPTVEEAHDFWVNILLPRLDRQVGDIHRIGEPTKDKVGWDEAVIALDNGLSALKTEISADPVKVLKGSTAFSNANKLFVAYGFKECGKP